MNVSKLVDDRHDLAIVEKFDETDYGRVILGALDRKAAEIQTKVFGPKSNPQINTVAMRDDLRYHLGMIEGLKWLAEFLREAREHAGKGESK